MSDKLDRWIGHMDHLARRIEFVAGCWVCEMGFRSKKFPQKADVTVGHLAVKCADSGSARERKLAKKVSRYAGQ